MIASELAAGGMAFLAWLLAASAWHKGWRPARGAAAVRDLLGLSATTARGVLWVAAAVEACTALLACVPTLQCVAAMLAAGIYFAYVLLLTRAVAQGRRDLDCGCTLSVGQKSVGPAQIAKSGALCGLACACAAVLSLFGAAVFSATAKMAGLAGLVLYVAAEQVSTLVPLRVGEHS